MKRVTGILKDWSGVTDDSIVLDFQDRHRRRIVLTTHRGLEFILDLAEVPDLRDGDALALSSDQVVRVSAAPERLMEITCTDPLHLARIAWHLGNRHLPTEIRIDEKKLFIHADHVIADMVKGLGGEVRELEAPFNPEGGAYGQAANAGQAHGHHHHHDDEHDHAHDHHHGHSHGHAHG